MSYQKSKTRLKTNDHGPEACELTKRELAKLKDNLLAERKAVLTRLGAHVGRATEDQETLADEADQASRATDQAFLLRLADKEHKLLNQIDRALQKFTVGSYGLCEGTGEPIEHKRLELRPWTRYSMEHKEYLEKGKLNRRYR